MNEFRFDAAIVLGEAGPAGVVRQRLYDGVQVLADWPEELAGPELRVAVLVRGERLEERDAPAYVELFFHDVFLLLNLAAPGTFGGTISIAGGELRVRELTFDPRVFSYAAPLATLPLEDVVRWYDGLRLGTQQLATDAVTAALVQLLHLARRPEREEEESIIRLAIAAKGLLPEPPARLLALRDDIAQGRGPIIHPMHDDALDPRVEDATSEWIEVADAAAHMVIRALQERVTRA